MKQKKRNSFAVLMDYAGSHRFLSYAAIVLAVISAWTALIPFYDIWLIVREILEVRPNFAEAVNIGTYGWQAVGL